MTDKKYPLTFSTWDTAEIAAIESVIASDRYTMGARVQDFEAAFADYVGARFAVMVNSGSSANLLMVAAMMYRGTAGLKSGDEVIVPAVSWATSYAPFAQFGITLRFVDVDVETLNYNLEELAQAVSDRTRIILAVNLLGNANDFAAINRIIGDRDIVLLEDNCESLGATFRGKQCGTFGLMGTYSTFYSHHICTMEGGLVVTNDDRLHELLLSLRAHGWTRNLPAESLIAGKRGTDPFDESYRFILPGYNLRPIEMAGAIGIEQLRKLPGFITQRRRNAEMFRERFQDHPRVIIQREIGESSWFGFSLIARPGSDVTRAEIRQGLEAAGFEVRPIVAGNFLRNEAMRWIPHVQPDPMPGADLVHESGLFIGNHHLPMREALQALEKVLR